jgi:hypothetical protein
MLLRRARDRCEQKSTEIVPNEESAHVWFHNFGHGTEKTSDFIAIFDWDDVRALVAAFAQAGNRDAIHFDHAMKMAAAIGYFAKNSN